MHRYWHAFCQRCIDVRKCLQHLLRRWRKEVIDREMERIQARGFQFVGKHRSLSQREHGLDAVIAQDSEIISNGLSVRAWTGAPGQSPLNHPVEALHIALSDDCQVGTAA